MADRWLRPWVLVLVVTPSLSTLPRRAALARAMAATTTILGGTPPTRGAAPPGTSFPSPDAVAAELDTETFDEWPFNAESFRRLDESDDALFYTEPRFVYHIDDAAVASLRRYNARVLADAAAALGNDRAQPVDVLDVGASWDSFLPPDVYRGDTSASRVIGVGLNRAELEKNPQLTERHVQDLNGSPKMPWLEDRSIDAALCAVSIDYLTRPREVLGEVARALRPGGTVHIAFSNRLFFSKAVAHWTGKSDLDHIDAVGAYLAFATGGPARFGVAEAERIDSQRGGDPLYVVRAQRIASEVSTG